MAFNNLDFKYSAFEFILFFQFFPFSGLAHSAKVVHKVRQTLTCYSWCWTKAKCIFWRFIKPVKIYIKSLLIKSKNCLFELSFKVSFSSSILCIKRITRVSRNLRFPLVKPVNLVKCNTEWGVFVFK
jgi:hypothetical protein